MPLWLCLPTRREKQQQVPADYRSPERSQGNYTLIGDCVVWSQDMYGFGQ